MNRFNRIAGTLGLIGLICLISAPAQALSIYGLVKDITGLGELGSDVDRRVDHAQNAVFAIQDRTDEIVLNWFAETDQFRAKVAKDVENSIKLGEDATKRVLEKAVKDAGQLQNKVFENINQSIQKVECAGQRTLKKDIPNLFGDMLDILGGNRIRIQSPVPKTCAFDLFCSNEKDFPIEANFALDTFLPIEAYLLSELERAKEADNAYVILSVYDHMRNFSRRSQCIDYDVKGVFFDRYVEYSHKAKLWRDIVDPLATVKK